MPPQVLSIPTQLNLSLQHAFGKLSPPHFEKSSPELIVREPSGTVNSTVATDINAEINMTRFMGTILCL